MKNSKESFCLLFAILIILSSCAKNEESVTKVMAAVPAPDSMVLVYTIKGLPPTKPGIEPSNPLPQPAPTGIKPPETHYEIIFNPTAAYLKETCLFDFSKLELGSTYHQINNKNINMAFFTSTDTLNVQRLVGNSSSPWSWNAHWNYSPYVESEHPDVLFTYQQYNVVIALSKPCIEFGVELSPNRQGGDIACAPGRPGPEFVGCYLAPDHHFSSNFGNFVRDYSAGVAEQRLKTPSGARLFAVKATKPFTVVSLHFDFENGNVDSLNGPRGIALAKIRYKLAK
jgi:hypothetical protein